MQLIYAAAHFVLVVAAATILHYNYKHSNVQTQLLLILNLYYKHSNVQTIAVCGQPKIEKNMCVAHVDCTCCFVVGSALLGDPCGSYCHDQKRQTIKI